MPHTNPYLYGLDRYQVTAEVVVAMFPAGGETYVYRGGILPADTRPSQIEHLLALGMIERIGATP